MAVVYVESMRAIDGYIFADKTEALAFAENSKLLDNDYRKTTIKFLGEH